jgi:polyribonucleotide 5'-hydroxyl-kinase
MAADSAVGPQRVAVPREHELRLEVGKDAPASFKLLSGNAEVFGAEAVEGRTNTVAPGRKLAIFTWYGCEVELAGNWTSQYVSSESAMPLIANLHQRLEARREEARATGGSGPRLLVVGATDSGKSSLVRTLASYAARVGRCTTVVDLDIGQGELSVPGTLTATPIDRDCLTVEETFVKTTPLSFWYGHTSVSDNVEPYRNALNRLADCLKRRLTHDPLSRVSGCIVNTMGLIEGAGYGLILNAVEALHLDVVVVLGSDKLFVDLTRDTAAVRLPVKPLAPSPAGAGGASAADAPEALAAIPAGVPTKTVTVIKLPRSGGAVERLRDSRAEARRLRVREYFYGAFRGSGVPPTLSPVTLTVGFDDVTIVRVGGATVSQGAGAGGGGGGDGCEGGGWGGGGCCVRRNCGVEALAVAR